MVVDRADGADGADGVPYGLRPALEDRAVPCRIAPDRAVNAILASSHPICGSLPGGSQTVPRAGGLAISGQK